MTNDDCPMTDSNALEHLLAHDREQLVAIASRVVRDQHEAEDVVQETLTAVWKRLHGIPADKLTHYLRRAVRQNAIKRSARRRYVASFGNELEGLARHDASSKVIDPIELEDAIESLPMSQQNVIRLKYYFGMTFHQIGTSLSISGNTAASRCRYALVRLKQILSR